VTSISNLHSYVKQEAQLPQR